MKARTRSVSLSMFLVLGSVAACASSPQRPAASAPPASGTSGEESAETPRASGKTLADHHREFMDQCTAKGAGMPDFCECSWDQMRQVFTDDEMDASTIDQAKLKTFEDRTRAACSSKIPEDRIKRSFSDACVKPSDKLAAYCDCKWGEFRKHFSAVELTDDAALKGQRLDDARRGTAKACGAKYVESVARDAFVGGCAKSDGLKPFCECAWKVLRQSASAAEVDLELVNFEDVKPKIAGTCAKLRPHA